MMQLEKDSDVRERLPPRKDGITFITDGLFISININSVAISEGPKTKVWNLQQTSIRGQCR